MAVTRLMTEPLRAAIAQLYRDLRWSAARRRGFNRRVCGVEEPRTTAEGTKVVLALEAIIWRLVQPHYGALRALVQTLYDERSRMTEWERNVFVPDVSRTLRAGARLSAATVKKAREVAHKYGVACGFPSVRELATAADATRAHTPARENTPLAGSKGGED